MKKLYIILCVVLALLIAPFYVLWRRFGRSEKKNEKRLDANVRRNYEEEK